MDGWGVESVGVWWVGGSKATLISGAMMGPFGMVGADVSRESFKGRLRYGSWRLVGHSGICVCIDVCVYNVRVCVVRCSVMLYDISCGFIYVLTFYNWRIVRAGASLQA